MTIGQEMVAHVVAAMLALTLAGLIARRRTALCRSFAAYLALALLTNRLVTWWPDTFYWRAFWIVKELAFTGLKLIIVMELAIVAFEALPRVRAVAVALLSIAAGITLLAMGGATLLVDHEEWIEVLLARGQAGVLWTFLVLVIVAAWFRVPLHHFHRTILIGFGLNVATYAVLLAVRFGRPALSIYVDALEPAAFAATLGLWLLAAWRTEPASEMGPALKSRLQPWAQ